MSEQKKTTIENDDELIDDADMPEDIRGKEPPKFLAAGDSIVESILARRKIKKYEPNPE